MYECRRGGVTPFLAVGAALLCRFRLSRCAQCVGIEKIVWRLEKKAEVFSSFLVDFLPKPVYFSFVSFFAPFWRAFVLRVLHAIAYAHSAFFRFLPSPFTLLCKSLKERG